jgi:predicted alpha/beta hydrolase family esterase
MKRVFIIHGWSGFPGEGWFPWLQDELESKGIWVSVPSMPNPDEPTIDAWSGHLAKVVGVPDSETYFVGHSIGCQSILRYVERCGSKIGGAVFVAGWFHLTNAETDEEKRIGKPWLETPIDFAKVRALIPKSVAIFSDDDPVVPLEVNRSIFESNLGSQIIVESAKGHFSGSDAVTVLPSALDAIHGLMN